MRVKLGRFGRGISGALLSVASLLCSQSVLAAPPSIISSQVDVQITRGEPVAINLRTLGVIAGSAPLRIENLQILFAGQQTGGLFANVFQSSPGAVCIQIFNNEVTPSPQFPVDLRFSVTNLGNQSTTVQTVRVTNQPGPTVNEGNVAACSDPNTRPVASAGIDLPVADSDGVAGETVTLDGTGSTDADPGTILSYVWFGANGAQIGVGPAPSVRLPDGANTIRMTVTDDSFDPQTNSSSDSVTITVGAPVPNRPPTANAGADQTIADTDSQPGENVTLNGTLSTDGDGTIASYQWLLGQTSLGSGATLGTRLPDGVNTVTLIVTDDDGATNTDTVQITIAAPAPNQPPVANAGPDQNLPDTDELPGEAVTLNGAQSSDADGTIASYEWFNGQTSLGTGATLATRLPNGVSTVTLVVTDNDEATASDTVQITVAAPTPNQAPTANAGPNQNVADSDEQPGETVTLNGTQSMDADGTIATYQWFLGQTSLGTGATLQAQLPDGVNTVTLVVTDDDQATGNDTVQVTVTAPTPNQAPTANAGADQTIADTDAQPGENVTLNGTQSADDDGTIASYEWFAGDTSLGTGATLQTRLPDGISTVTLIVTDNDQATDEDTVQVTVNAPTPNAAPTANAGADQTQADSDAQPGENVILDGTLSSDSDGTIASYEWFLGQTSLGTEATLETRLPDGVNVVTLVVFDDDEATDSDTVQITVAAPTPNQAPTANAGADQSVADTDAQPGENVTLNGAQSSDADGTIASYEWFAGDTSLGTGATLETRLPDGANSVTLIVTDNDDATGEDTVQITVGALVPNEAPVANAGADNTLADTDGEAGENVTLNGASSTDADGTIDVYEWFANDASLGTGVTLQTRLPDGVNAVTLVVTDDDAATASDTVQITIAGVIPNQAPTSNPGIDQTVADSDSQPGENVTLNGTQSTDADGSIATYQWLLGDSSLGTGATLQTRLPDGINIVTLVVTDDDQAAANETVQITITAPVANQAPTANAGADETFADTDAQPGEIVMLDGSQSTDVDGTIASYQWFLGDTPLGAGATLQARLPDGTNVVTLIVTDDDRTTASDTTQLDISAPVQLPKLADIPNLTKTQRAVAVGLDGACERIFALSRGEQSMSSDQSDLEQRCRGLLIDNTQEQQVAALDALAPTDFSLARTQTLLFSNMQYARVMDRLMALRGGARGLSLAGLNINVDGSPVPLAELKDLGHRLLGSGASADDPNESGGLLSDRWGLWTRGNVSFGDGDETAARPSFEADQWAVIGGVDYRLTNKAVVGAALAYGNSTIDFIGNEGALDTTTWALSVYGSLYAAKNFYFDAIANVGDSVYDADRNITYADGAGLVTADAEGTTNGMTMSLGLSAGYDLLLGGLTISPSLGAFFIDAKLDNFTEHGAGGLNLIYDDQQFQSLTANLGFRATYTWNLRWGVLLPHVRVDYVREFEDEVDVFGVRLASDPNAQDVPPILIETDNPDPSYWRLAAGFSAQLRRGISGYVEYQRLQGFESISFADLSLGVRFQKEF